MEEPIENIEQLKPCPFCGKAYNTGHYDECYFRGRYEKDENKRRKAWAVRPLEDALRAELEAMTADRDSEQRWANEYHQQAERLQAELEDEKYSHWQSDQALITAHQEIDELHALNLYDLVGDADQFRADMVATIKERDELRARVDRLLGNIGLEIAKHAWTKHDLERARAELSGKTGELEELEAELSRVRFEAQAFQVGQETAWKEADLAKAELMETAQRLTHISNNESARANKAEAELQQAREALALIHAIPLMPEYDASRPYTILAAIDAIAKEALPELPQEEK